MPLMATQAFKPEWGRLIKTLREQLGESQVTFAARWGVNQATVSYWENNQADPPGEVTWWLVEHMPHVDEYGNQLLPCKGDCINPEDHHK